MHVHQIDNDRRCSADIRVTHPAPPVMILRLPQVKKMVGLGKSAIYAHIARQAFPAPISLGGRARGWLFAEVQQWLLDQIQKSRPTNSNQLYIRSNKNE